MAKTPPTSFTFQTYEYIAVMPMPPSGQAISVTNVRDAIKFLNKYIEQKSVPLTTHYIWC